MKNFSMSPPNIIQPIIVGKPFFKRKPIELQDKIIRWRGIADMINLSDKGRLRLEWIIFFETIGNHDAYDTAKHFNIAPKTFYKWFSRFDNGKVKKLEDGSSCPKNTRKWQVTASEECRIMKLRKEKMHYGKMKLQRRYLKRYGEEISTWKIEKVIRKHDMYPDQTKAEKQRNRLKNTVKKNRIQKLNIKEEHWFLLHLDTIVIYWGSVKRYILTAIDHHGKIAYARMYTAKSSRSAKDFLYRLHYLIDADILNIQTDNGSEFFAEFEETLKQLLILHWFSRPRTPKDNSVVEKFNQTLQYEWLNDGNFTPNINEFNKALTEWLEEYNFERPHQTLDYQTPFEYLEYTLGKQQKLLPTYSASALSVLKRLD
jgi:transposase InsO family protein